MELFKEIQNFLLKENCDYLYINHTNRFFSEYVDIKKSSRYLLTKFTGSVGDAIVSKEKIYLFVDSRYWEQAEKEVNTDLVEIIKIGKSLSFEESLIINLPARAKILMNKDKTSFQLYEQLKKLGYKIKLTDKEFIQQYTKTKETKYKKTYKKIPLKIVGNSKKNKIKKIQTKLSKDEVAIISSLEDVSYLLNIRSNVFEHSSVAIGKLIITKSDYKFYQNEKDFEKELKEISTNRDIKFLIDKKSLSIRYKRYIKNTISSNIIETLRSIKYKAEIDHLEKCFAQTDKVIETTIKALKENNFTEIELQTYINEAFLKNGAETNSFKTILASGENSSIVHFSHPTDKKIKKGEFILLDCGGIYEGGYATDITRTFLIGEPTEEQKVVYTIVLKAFLNAYNADLSQNKTFFEIDKIARTIIEKSKPEGFIFGHGLGHSVGRSVHDGLPIMSPSIHAKMKIKKNMVCTIEPGLYKTNWGGVRLENTIYVISENKKLKFKSFSKAPFQKNLIDFDLLTSQEKHYLKEWELI